jgi:DHA1 family bicyclomycin/chloramphenicol resistance-like MFS transporter
MTTIERKTSRPGFTEGRAFVILLGALTAFDPLSIDMYLPAFPRIQKDLGTTYAAVELSLSAFFIGMATGQLVYGPLADRFGRKKPLLFGMLIYMCATLGCAFSTNIAMLILFRVLQAFGGCAGMVITRAIVRDLFDRKRSAHFLSSLMLVMGLAPILAPLIGGYINQAVGWRAIFGLLATANLICMLGIFFLLPETLKVRPSELKLTAIVKTYWDLLCERDFVLFVFPDAAIRAGMFAYIAGSPFVFIEIFHVAPEHYGWV